MKRNRVFRLMTSLTAVVLYMIAFSVTAFASGDNGDYYTGGPPRRPRNPPRNPPPEAWIRRASP